MKALELTIEKQGFTMSANVYPANSHINLLITLGRIFPTTAAQAKKFISNTNSMDFLNADDVEIIENLLNKHGFQGDYKTTKSGAWVILNNINDLKSALKKEYCLDKNN